jgi:hypothetical protein
VFSTIPARASLGRDDELRALCRPGNRLRLFVEKNLPGIMKNMKVFFIDILFCKRRNIRRRRGIVNIFFVA